MGDVFNVDPLPVPVQDLDEPAHMCPFEVVRQVYIHIDRSDRVLGAVFLVQHRDGITDALHPDLVDFNVAVVFQILNVSNGFFALLHAIYLLLIHLLPWVVGS